MIIWLRKVCSIKILQINKVENFLKSNFDLLRLCARFFDSMSSNIDEVLSINLSANVFVFGDVNVHHKHWLTYSSGTDRPGELCYNLSYSLLISQMTLLIYPETLKYWVGVQRGQSNLMGRRCLFSLGWRPF